MRFAQTPLQAVFELHGDRHEDERGTFERIYCASEFQRHSLDLPDRQTAISRNTAKGTLRGLHFIPEADGEAKLVRCIRGKIFDVAVDLRPSSLSFLQYFSAELTADRGNALFLPRGVAHGFITLENDCDVLYQFSRAYRRGIERGMRWDDPMIAIAWPLAPLVMSAKDRALPLVSELHLGGHG